MCLGGKVYEDQTNARQPEAGSSTIRIQFRDLGYVNFRFAGGASVRHALAIMAIVNILQRSIITKTELHADEREAGADLERLGGFELTAHGSEVRST
jgi:hypothetical protein